MAQGAIVTAARKPGLDWVRALYVQHSGGYEKHGQDMIVEEGTGRTIAVVYDGAFYSERIVEACNAHDSLVSQRDAMANVLRVVARGACLNQVTGNTCYCYVCMAQDAILAIADGAKGFTE